VQVASRGPDGQVSTFAEAICPVEFDGTPQTAILDLDLCEILSKLPAQSLLTWISDSCHSGDLWQEGEPGADGVRRFPLPIDLAWRVHTAQSAGRDPSPMLQADRYDCDIEFLAACGPGQEAREVPLPDAKGVTAPHGVFTYHLLQRLYSRANRALPLESLVESLAQVLQTKGFEQVPQLDGAPRTLLQSPFLAAYPPP